MRATTLLLCMAGALLASSQSGDATSSKMFPAMRIGLDLGSSFLRRLAEMKEKIREDIDRQAPTWTRLMNQQQPFGHVPWPVLGLQGSLSHGFQDFAVPEQQAPPAPRTAASSHKVLGSRRGILPICQLQARACQASHFTKLRHSPR
ncbi:hypothetical protein IscW_ISCW019413 [Ixodes scapularis]|uniref:Uncharacterized protein n=1 Tax=Ixodes scapularis TaxID=6945 RepID=B7PSA4_IXOSC|nr:hypothetical protein IscW_ISCW019413 [Ixodes scapularis]|eukprot:XP_002402122.1 hypothetical protein IscW_ISCW019413 [Ixodes scapularis]